MKRLKFVFFFKPTKSYSFLERTNTARFIWHYWMKHLISVNIILLIAFLLFWYLLVCNFPKRLRRSFWLNTLCLNSNELTTAEYMFKIECELKNIWSKLPFYFKIDFPSWFMFPFCTLTYTHFHNSVDYRNTFVGYNSERFTLKLFVNSDFTVTQFVRDLLMGF